MSLATKSNPDVPLANLGQDRQAIRVCFYRNGDKYYDGFNFPILFLRYRNLDTLMKDLNRSVFCDQRRLPHGVRCIFDLDGVRIKSISDMVDGGHYVCSSSHHFIRMNYLNDTYNPVWKTTNKNVEPKMTVRPLVVRDNHPIRSYSLLTNSSVQRSSKFLVKNSERTIIVLKNGPSRPRQMYRWSVRLNPLPIMETLMEDLADLLEEEKIFHLYTAEGFIVSNLPDILKNDSALIAFAEEEVSETDFLICKQELSLINYFKYNKVKAIQSNVQITCASRSNPWKKMNDTYDIGDKIGSGNFSTVRECRNKKNNIMGALKRIDLKRCTGDVSKLHAEISILREVEHPNIIKLLDEFKTSEYLYLVLEHIVDGDLINTVLNSKYYSEHDVSGMMHNIISGICHLHSLNIVHRDIKIENVLVCRNTNGLKKLKICDFGLATKIDHGKRLYTVCGTPNYMAPEIIIQDGYDTKVDVWATGVFLYTLLHGSPPFHSKSGDFNAVFENIVSGNYDLSKPTWDIISRDARTLISMMLEANFANRLSAEEVLHYPWVSGDKAANSVNLRDTVGVRLQRYFKGREDMEKKEFCVLASTALDKESNFFEKAPTEVQVDQGDPRCKKES